MRAKYLVQWFPPIIHEEIDKVKIKKMMDEYEQEMLKNELGTMLFGDNFNPILGNAELPSCMAGQLGGKVREWKNVLLTETININKRDS